MWEIVQFCFMIGILGMGASMILVFLFGDGDPW